MLLDIIAIVFTVPYMGEDSLGETLFYISQNVGIFYMAWLIYKGKVEFENKIS